MLDILFYLQFSGKIWNYFLRYYRYARCSVATSRRIENLLSIRERIPTVFRFLLKIYDTFYAIWCIIDYFQRLVGMERSLFIPGFVAGVSIANFDSFSGKSVICVVCCPAAVFSRILLQISLYFSRRRRFTSKSGRYRVLRKTMSGYTWLRFTVALWGQI